MSIPYSSCVWDLDWIYCPRHAGVRGNERADGLVSTASVAGNIAMDMGEIGNMWAYASR